MIKWSNSKEKRKSTRLLLITTYLSGPYLDGPDCEDTTDSQKLVNVFGLWFSTIFTAIAAIMDTLDFAYSTNFDNFAFLLCTSQTFKTSFMLFRKVRAFVWAQVWSDISFQSYAAPKTKSWCFGGGTKL